MSLDALGEYLLEQLHHELATEAWAAQLKDSNFEDEQVREVLQPILHDTDNFAVIFNDVARLAGKITDGENTWKALVGKKVNPSRVNAFFWIFLDKALAKDSNTRDIEYGLAAASAWLQLSGLKGAALFHFFDHFLYKMVLSLIRIVYRLKMYGSRFATTKKKAGGKGKKAAKKSAPMREESDQEEEQPLTFSRTELDDMLEKSCSSLYSLLKNTALSACPEQARETVDLVRDLIRLDVCKETDVTPLLSQGEIRSRERMSDRAFGLAHLLCESRHSNGGLIVHARLLMPRLLFFSWEGEVVPGTQSIPVVMTVARDLAVAFLKMRLVHSKDADELETIAKLVSNIIVRCPERLEYRQRVAQSALDLLSILPKKTAQAQLQLLYTFGMTTKTGLRAMAIEMIPTIIKDMDLDEDEEQEQREEEAQNMDESKSNAEDEEMDEEEADKTRKNGNKKQKDNDGEEDEDEENITTRKEARKKKQRKQAKCRESDEEEEEEKDEDMEEEDHNKTKRRGKADKNQSTMKKKKMQEKEGTGEESEGEADRKKKKKEAEKKKKDLLMRTARVKLRPALLTLIVRGCIDKGGNLRSRSLHHLAVLVREGRADELRAMADQLVRDHPRVILQATSNIYDGYEENEDEEDEDEEKKKRAADLAQLATEELQIENGLMYLVKTRLEDEVAAVRRAAISCVEALFFSWNKSDEEAEELANSLKVRCLDTSLMVRKQAIDTLSTLLGESLQKGHRLVLENIWLKAVLPLINDRENSVQSMAATLVEEHLITPLMGEDTPDSSWNMLKRVEEEVSNRRLLVRTLALLSQRNTIKEKVIEMLNKKLNTDEQHANVIWMLLSDLSMVFKIDPQIAVRTWFSLAEDDTANMLSYVAKVVGEGAVKLNDADRDRIASDIEEKLFGYRVHGPHIATVYLTLARLMDAVGELATGTQELQRFGRRLLEEASRIIYHELDMFAEKEEEEFTEVPQKAEIRVIRIVVTIGEVIQLSPSLMDEAENLLDGLKKIMASELYLSEELRQRRILNSAVPSLPQSRVPTAMGDVIGGSQQTQTHSAMGHVMEFQERVIPSQLAKVMKDRTLRKALFTPAVRRCALTTIGKFCLMDERIAKKCIATFVEQLKENPDHIIRNNIVVVLCDLCIRYTLLVDRYTPIIASCLKDRATLVRHQTLECLTILIKEAFIRWEGQLMYRFVATILDECRPIREYATFCLKDILLPQNPCMFFNHFIECLLYFNDVPRKYKMGDQMAQNLDGRLRFSLSGEANEPARMKLYQFMLATFDDKQKFITMAKMCEEIFQMVYTGERRIEDKNVAALLTDAFKIIACENMQLRLETGRKEGEDEEEAPKQLVEKAKEMITKVFRNAIITSIMPHVLELRRYLIECRHPAMKYMMGVLRALTRSHMDSLKEFFGADKLALREIEYDIKRLNNLEEKMKLRAAAAAKEEALRAATRRLTMGERRKEEEKRMRDDEEGHISEEVRREMPPHSLCAQPIEEDGAIDVEMESVAIGGEMDVKVEADEVEMQEEPTQVQSESDNGEENEKDGEKTAVEDENEQRSEHAKEVTIKKEIVEEEEDKENEKKIQRRERMTREREKRMAAAANKVKEEEPMEERGEETSAAFAIPSTETAKKVERTRAASEVGWLNESAMVGGYGQSTPRKGSPEEEDRSEGVPRMDLDISAIGPPLAGPRKTRISRKPQSERIDE